MGKLSESMDVSLEEIARISRESRSAAQPRTFLRLTKMRKGESIVLRLTGGWGKKVNPAFGEKDQQGNDIPSKQDYFKYEFEVVEGIDGGEITQGDIAVWDAPKTYFNKLDPLMRMGHRVFKVTRTHIKGEKDAQGNILNIQNYEILSLDAPNPALAIAS